jgi:L-fucose mutarotase/ribose pyranase (RbsD/FucU family)
MTTNAERKLFKESLVRTPEEMKKEQEELIAEIEKQKKEDMIKDKTRPTYEQVRKAYLVYGSGETNGGEFWDILSDYFKEESK